MDACGMKTPITRFKAIQETGCASPFLKIPPSSLLETLGYGTGVQVYLVQRSPQQGRHRSPWAVKKINKTAKHSQTYSNRLKEAGILKSLNHSNIVGFRALMKSSDGSLCLALEHGEKSLLNLIEDRADQDHGPFPAPHIMKMSTDIVAALSYLHGKQWLHGDLKSANVLIKGQFEIAKLCDFGVAIKLDENMTAPSHMYVGTESWSPKEALAQSKESLLVYGRHDIPLMGNYPHDLTSPCHIGKTQRSILLYIPFHPRHLVSPCKKEMGSVVSDRSDIYAFGLTIYEMLTLSIPHFNFPNEDDFESETDFNAACEEIERQAVQSLGTRPLLPDHGFTNEYQITIELFFVCSDEDQKRRPSASQIQQVLDVKVQRTLVFD